MHKKLFGALYIINIGAEALFTLVLPAALFWGIAWLTVTYLSFPDWVFVPAIVLGLLLGFYMMIKFILTAMEGLERLEKEQKERLKKQNKSNENNKNG